MKNNKDKFLEDFYFELSDKEFEYLRSKYSTAKFAKTRVNPKVFTEQDVYMLATVLKSDIAIEVNLAIMRTFTKALDDLINESKVVESKTIGIGYC